MKKVPRANFFGSRSAIEQFDHAFCLAAFESALALAERAAETSAPNDDINGAIAAAMVSAFHDWRKKRAGLLFFGGISDEDR